MSMPEDLDCEVFLNFRGADTGTGLTNVLSKCMKDVRIRVFYANQTIREGEEIAGKIEQAIKNCHIYVAIFSADYASSRWCLRELEMMYAEKESKGKEILPIFYGVTPEDVKLETELYSRAFQEHKGTISADTVQRWEYALKCTAKIKGWNVADPCLADFSEHVAKQVLSKLENRHLSCRLVGMDNRVEEVKKLLDVESGDVRFLIIHGKSGTGKSTLARVVFEQLSLQFQGCSFVADIRESSMADICQSCGHDGYRYLRSRLIQDIPIGDKSVQFKERFRDMKVLIVLDDVYRREHILKLKSAWFGPGSRIIVTTTTRSILPIQCHTSEGESPQKPKEFWDFEMKELGFSHAFQLLSQRAFGKDEPPESYDSLFRNLFAKVTRLPLTLEIVGSYLHRKDKEVWKDTIQKFEKLPRHETNGKLEIIYDALTDEAKEIFLDIACFFVNKEKAVAFYMWEGCEVNKEIEALTSMSLLKVVDNKLWMHKQLRDLGRDVVRKRIYGDLGRYSRLWIHDEAFEVLKTRGQKEVEALRLCLDDSLKNCTFTDVVFEGLEKLRFLQIYLANLAGDFKDLLLKLRWLSWHFCPSELKANNLSLFNLVILDLSKSFIGDEWTGWNQLEEANNLKVLDLTSCKGLVKSPNFSQYKKLERLILDDCSELAEISKSIGNLRGLKCLKIKGCDSLKGLPDEIGSLQALVEIVITKNGGGSFCLPPSIGFLESLEILIIVNVELTQLPPSIGRLKQLKTLSLFKCAGVEQLPESLGNLNLLTELDISWTKIVMVPNSIGNLKKLKVLKMEGSLIKELPCAIGMMEKLEELHAKHSKNLQGEIPEEIGQLSHLKLLDLSHTGGCGLPSTLCKLSLLQTLKLKSSKDLQHFPELPQHLTCLCIEFPLSKLNGLADLVICDPAERCFDWIKQLSRLKKLELVIPDLIALNLEFGTFTQLRSVRLSGQSSVCCLQLPSSLRTLSLVRFKVEKELSNFSTLKNLSFLELQECSITGDLDIGELDSLVHFSMSDCEFSITNRLHLPDHLRVLRIKDCEFSNTWLYVSGLKCLKQLKLLNCNGLVQIQGIGELDSLQELVICQCNSIRRLDGDISNLENLKVVCIRHCELLTHIEGHERLHFAKRITIIGSNLQTAEKKSRSRKKPSYAL